MKSVTCFIVCAILILQYNSVDAGIGDLFKDVHESVHDTIHKVRTDIKNVLAPKKGEQESESKPTPETPTDEKKPDTEKDSDVKPVETTTQSTTTTTASAVKTETTTKKDGRENFSGACLPGYFRTADGRCKPSY